ncbi:hypothetical protein L479_01592 [Exiguobacterium sp. S17]|nr:hypothetical protein L479_01592 [Exiguobacterium sp. S17]
MAAFAQQIELQTGFVVPWDPVSKQSLAEHYDRLQKIADVSVSVIAGGKIVETRSSLPPSAIVSKRVEAPRLTLVVQNASGGQWFGEATAAWLSDSNLRAQVAARLVALAQARKANGVMIDFEAVPAGAQADLLRLLADLHGLLSASDLRLAVTVPVADPAWDLTKISARVDEVVAMAYDQHWPGGDPGPIAATDWFREVVARLAIEVPLAKLTVAVASYAYDWPSGAPAMPVPVPTALAVARSHDSAVVTDAGGGAHYSYREGSSVHQVWLATAGDVYRQISFARALGIRKFALWRLGTEDAAIWTGRITSTSRSP